MSSVPDRAGNRKRLRVVLALTTVYLIAEVVGGMMTGSLALLADAGHMLTDVFGLTLALFATWFAGKPATRERTYGFHRSEILAALANAVVLFYIAGYILYEAWHRFRDPQVVDSGPMLAVAVVGLVVNLIAARLLRQASEESLNMRGAYFEVIGDLLGSIAVIAAAAIIYFTGWYFADPLFSVAIGLFILPRTWKLLREAVGILLEGVPAHLDVREIERTLAAVPGVELVHDLHVWTLTSGTEALSGHLVITKDGDAEELLRKTGSLLRERYGIEHTTIQVEAVDASGSEPRGW